MKNRPKTTKRSDITSLKAKLTDAEGLIGVISRGKSQWEATFDAISDPLLIVDKKLKIVRANMAAAKLAGIDIRELIGKNYNNIFETENSDFVVNTFPFKDKVDKVDSAVIHLRDVSEERRLQHELVQQEKMVAIGMLAGGVAHEINNPLGGIIAFAQILKKDLGPDNQYFPDVEEIECAALRCKKIVQDLLDFSRVSSGKKKQWLDINSLVEKILPFVKMELRSLNIQLDTNFEQDMPNIYGDATRLQQVFLNLLTNACHSMEKGGVLKIRSFPAKENSIICIEVSDTGCGISKEDMNKIFDPFFTTKRPGKGTGLGLSISYKIVKSHDGTINVKSKVGEGSTFTVCIPTAKEWRSKKWEVLSES